MPQRIILPDGENEEVDNLSPIQQIRRDRISAFMENPDTLLYKEPFKRGGQITPAGETEVTDKNKMRISKPKRTYKVITQDQFLEELNPATHKVLFDDNVPHICIKTNDGQFREIEHRKVALPYQVNVKDKKVLHLCGNPMDFTLLHKNPSEQDVSDFVTFKEYWEERNQDGMRTRFVDAQKSMGDAGLLYYMDYKGRIKSRLLCYRDGYVLCPHNDPNGDRLIESVYYVQEDDTEIIESWDDTMHYKHIKTKEAVSDNQENKKGWDLVLVEEHGFSEIPLITHRGEVAWDRAQNAIEVLEIIWNIFTVIQKRHGWGILYVKGNIKPMEKTIAGSVILEDTNREGKGSAEFKTPPNPNQMIEFIKELKYEVQTASGATFILPQDIKMSGDISAIAIQLSQSLDNEEALKGATEWQNVASKMCRLFREGLALELAGKDIDNNAVQRFDKLRINAKFVVWMPKSETDYNQMLAALKNAGLISQKTGIEKNTQSKPDEEIRIKNEAAEAAALELEQEVAKAEATAAVATVATDDTNTNNE